MKKILLYILLFSVTTTSIYSFAKGSNEKNTTTFEQFGGKTGLQKVVDDLLINIAGNPKIARFFAKVDQNDLKAKLTSQFCMVLDGPCEYNGKNMKDAHEGLEINKSHFNALVEDLQKAMDKNNIPERAQNKLLAKLASMHRDVIEKK